MNQLICRPSGRFVSGLFMAISVIAAGLGISTIKAAETLPGFTGEKTSWHGFDRYDFVLDDSTLAITPFKSVQSEGDGINPPPTGQHRCIIVVPKHMAQGNPWSWRGCYWNHMPQAEIELLKRGFCVAYISADATLKPGKEWDAWYAFLVEQHGLSPKPAFIGMSRGGEYAYTWATTHPDKVSCIYADNPGGNPEILLRIGELAPYDVPLLHVCGSLDPLLGKYSATIEGIYQQFGRRISVMIKEGYAHHPHSLQDPKPIADFIEQSVEATNAPPPAFVPEKFSRTSYYSLENIYHESPQEGTYLTCRGPFFTPCYDRYQFNIGHMNGAGLNIIVPKTPAAGNPWIFRAGLADRDAAVDLALLAKGYYIVTGPVPYDVGPVPAEWDATYRYLTGFGFSKKPVMEGAGAAAGEVYAWAMQNPDKVSCIYSENPILRSNLSKIPLFDSLSLLVKAGIPLISVCGSLDPGFNENTRVIQQRYQDLGGKIRIIVKDGVGHYPLAPQDPAQVADLITTSTVR